MGEVEVQLLRYLTSMFIDVFGITHPSEAARDRAAGYIGLLLAGLIFSLFLAIAMGIRLITK